MLDRTKKILVLILFAFPAAMVFAGNTSANLRVNVAVSNSCVLLSTRASYDAGSSTMSGQLDTRCSLGTPIQASLTTVRFPAITAAVFTEPQDINVAFDIVAVGTALKTLDEDGEVDEESWHSTGDGGVKWKKLLKYRVKREKVTASGNVPSLVYALVVF